MKLSVVFRSVAKNEYDAAAAWYEAQQQGLGGQFEAEVQRVLNEISDDPDRFPKSLRDIREAATKRFPYCVYYRVKCRRIIVIGVFHQSRDPAEWSSRG